MKIGEIRTLIKTHKREQLEQLLVELYKLVPKDKKEDNNVDQWIEKPPQKQSKKITKTRKTRSIAEISKEVEFFCSNAYEQNYLAPNRSIPKKERPKWRFVVKRLYKEIQAAIDAGNDPVLCINELENLYKVLTYACHWQIFSAYDPFESVGIAQSEFFDKLVVLMRNHKDLEDFIQDCTWLIINNPLNRYTLHTELIKIFTRECNTNDLLNLCYSETKIIRDDVMKEPDDDQGFSFSSRSSNGISYEKKRKLNCLSEIGFMAKIELCEYDAAIKYFNEHYIENSAEVKLYILVSLLFKHKLKTQIENEIESNIHLMPRKGLLDLLQYIKINNKLPKYM
jgi:hypothetical protein